MASQEVEVVAQNDLLQGCRLSPMWRSTCTMRPLSLLLFLLAGCRGSVAGKHSRCEWSRSWDENGAGSTDSPQCIPAADVVPLHLNSYRTAAAKGNLAAKIASKFGALNLASGGSGFYYAVRNGDGYSMGCPPPDTFPWDATIYRQLELAECGNGAGVSGVKLGEAFACVDTPAEKCSTKCGCISLLMDSYPGATPNCMPKALFSKPIFSLADNATLALLTNFTEDQAGACAQHRTLKACNAACNCTYTPQSKCVPKGLLETGLTQDEMERASQIVSAWGDRGLSLNWDTADLPAGFTQKEVGCCKNRVVLNDILYMGMGHMTGMTVAMRSEYNAEAALCASLVTKKTCLAAKADIAEDLVEMWKNAKSPKSAQNCTAPQ